MAVVKLWRRHVVCCESDVGICICNVRWGRSGVYGDCGTSVGKLAVKFGTGEWFCLAGLIGGARRGFEHIAKAIKGLTERE